MKWGLRGARSGWTTETYQYETTLSEHLIQTHMQVNSAEVSRLYDRNAQASVAAAADRMWRPPLLHNPVSAANCLFGLLAAPPLFFYYSPALRPLLFAPILIY